MNPDFEFHELADVFPLLEGPQFAELVEDVRQHGIREPVVLYDWKILDGRNRYRAANAAGRTCEFVAYGHINTCNVEKTKGNDEYWQNWDYTATPDNCHIGLCDDDEIDDAFQCEYLGDIDDLPAFVISKNLRRRHLDESQRAMVAQKLETLEQGRPVKDASLHVSRIEAAKLLNVSPRLVATAKTVHREAVPEIVHAVEQGEVSVSAAAQFARQPREDQTRLIADAGTTVDAVKAFRESLPSKHEATALARKLETETGATHAVLGKDGKYHAGASAAEIEVGQLYLTMTAALRAVVALKTTPAEALVASVSPQSRMIFPSLLDDVERVVANLRTEWMKNHGQEIQAVHSKAS